MKKNRFNNRYTQLPSDFYSLVSPEAMPHSQLVHVNELLMAQLDCPLSHDELLGLLSGDSQLPITQNKNKSQSLAQKYTGHQFGYYNPDLGDGRGVLLGQLDLPTCKNLSDSAPKKDLKKGKNNLAWSQQTFVDLHLKGAGTTPYSRGGDGRAVLRSTIREYLASEALHGLGIPTTRALAIAKSDADLVRREGLEPRATLIRVSPSHIRFGHFEWAKTQSIPHNQRDEKTHFNVLCNKVLKWHYPECLQAENPTAALLTAMCSRTATLIAGWQSVGFNHGVMNTDNMSILGETFDFGPYAFFDDFEIGYVCNHSDEQARYAFNEQPKMGLWNCQVLANTFRDHLSEADIASALNTYVNTYNASYIQKMMTKLGCKAIKETDKNLVGDLLVLLDQQRVDFSLFFRRLALLNEDKTKKQPLLDLFSQPKLMKDWFTRYRQRIENETNVADAILANNPSIQLRNYIAQEIIEAAEKNDFTVLAKWITALQSPFEEHNHLAQYQTPPSKINKSQVLSCSS